jgi:hypothetical protein
MTPLFYLKAGGALALVLVIFGSGYHIGGLAPTAALEADHASMAQAATGALLAQRAASEAQAINDNTAQVTHGKDIAKIDATPPRTDPVIVYVHTPNPVRIGPVPGTEAQAGGVPADPQGGGSDLGRGVNIRAALDSLEVKYEKVLADYRQLDSEWPK